MINSIFKYRICTPFDDLGGVFEIEIPGYVSMCDVAMQDEELFAWAIVEPDMPSIKIKFKVYGTGWAMEGAENLSFLKTVHTDGGMVWHVFRVK